MVDPRHVAIMLAFLVFDGLAASRGSYDVHAAVFIWISGAVAIVMICNVPFEAWLRQDMRYALTNERVIIYRPRPFAQLTSVGLRTMPKINFTNLSGGRGTIMFGPPRRHLALRGDPDAGRLNGSLDTVPQLIGIENADRVLKLIKVVTGQFPPETWE
jgi:hypothetical protein